MTTPEEEFESWWMHYPRKVDKGHARRAFAKARKVASLPDLIEGADKFGKLVKSKGTPAEFVPHPATWLNGERWADEELTPKAPLVSRRVFVPEPEVPAEERMTAEQLQEVRAIIRGGLGSGYVGVGK